MLNKSFKRRYAVVIFLFSIFIQLTAFQNCSPGLQTQDMSNLKSSSESQSNSTNDVAPTTPPLKCSPTLAQTCETESGYGHQFCTSAGVPQSCNLETCKSGYSMIGGTCAVNSCVANTATACTGLNGSGKKTCNATGTAYGSCLITACSSGYNLQSGSCVLNACVPNQVDGCVVSHGSGSLTCNAQGSAYGSCKLIKCNDGYESLDGTTCSQIKFKVVKTQPGFSCGITLSDTVKCWGDNTYGTLGNNSIDRSSTPVEVIGVKNVVSIAIGRQHACALMSDATVKCWGGANRNSSSIEMNYSLLGDGSNKGSLVPIVVGVNNVVQIAAGTSHTCALISDGTVKCWGLQYNGALGTLQPFNVAGTPVAYGVYTVENITNAKNLFSGDNSNCVITTDDQIKCWGISFLDKTKIDFSPVVVSILGNQDLTQISLANRTACVLTASGSIKCIGANDAGQLGNNSMTDNYTKLSDVTGGLVGIKKIESADGYFCAITSSNGVKCWGANYYGNLGNDTQANSSVPVDVIDLVGVKSLSLNGFFACAWTAKDELKCWGMVNDPTANNNISKLKPYQLFQ